MVFPKINPKQMEKMMRQMGVKHTDIPAKEVIIKQENSDIVIKQPSVTKINMAGNETYQVTGKAEVKERVNEEDIKTVMEQASVSKEEAIKALKENNFDIAATILELKK